MSGRHEFKNGIKHTIRERERMSLKTFTLPQMLTTAGYTSGIFGKGRLGDEAASPPSCKNAKLTCRRCRFRCTCQYAWEFKPTR